MPANKYSESPAKWESQFYYTDWTGKRKKKHKRGFNKRKEALEWERNFLKSTKADVSMKLSSFVDIYLNDMDPRLRGSTMDGKRFLFDKLIIPYFGEKPLCSITAANIRQWQATLLETEFKPGKKYSATYLKTVNNQITALFNYACRYYNLRENPCHKAGSMGKKNADEMQFWTLDEYKKFREAVKDKSRSFMAFQVLYYTGCRIGELMALTKADVDLSAGTISISKTYSRRNGEDVITPPKTPKSNRIIAIPSFLCDELRDYMATIYGLQEDGRIFPFTKYFLEHEMQRGCKISGVKKIRLHDLRHSHASLLIEMGFSPLLIADRLGHEKVETTLNTYSHLWPHKQEEVVSRLQSLEKLPCGSRTVLKNPEKENKPLNAGIEPAKNG
ncbi:site-specific integrase [Caproicibacterium sp. BJN0003]|uniref:site-specific integrase n=1 Tax=Caproicibacterium sp. BJN0003 TaxID=2994078 RepID=UPI0022543F6A|nr:site-specific integrase [Caproicibacterium sp. BJN0003]UZT81251.1 site-specific integrase [Caproicibacterium sp. BJN0003]